MLFTPSRCSITPGHAALDERLRPAARRVLSLLGAAPARGGWCYPTNAELSSALHVDRATVARALKQLRELSYVESRRNVRDPEGRYHAAAYRVRLDVPGQCAARAGERKGALCP